MLYNKTNGTERRGIFTFSVKAVEKPLLISQENIVERSPSLISRWLCDHIVKNKLHLKLCLFYFTNKKVWPSSGPVRSEALLLPSVLPLNHITDVSHAVLAGTDCHVQYASGCLCTCLIHKTACQATSFLWLIHCFTFGSQHIYAHHFWFSIPTNLVTLNLF